MSLVPLDYGSSSDSDADSEPNNIPTPELPQQQQQPSSSKPPPASLFANLPPPSSRQTNALPPQPSKNLFAALPPPRSASSSSTTNPPKRPNADSADRDAKRGKRVKIYVDLPRVGDDEDEDDDTKGGKGVGEGKPASSAVSDLFSRLPPPKKSAGGGDVGIPPETGAASASASGVPRTAPLASTPMVPYTLSKKNKSKPMGATGGSGTINKPLPPSNDPVDDEDEIGADEFFTLSNPTPTYTEDEPTASASADYTYTTPSASAQYAYSASAQYAYTPEVYGVESYPPETYPSGPHPFPNLPSNLPHDALRALSTPSTSSHEINITEITQSSLIDTHWTPDTSKRSSTAVGHGGGVSKAGKRKHTIMALAVDARARQDALAEAAAQKRVTKAATRAKYGF
ncbi:uncharacterized protein EV422DRAFT_144045 [Fimicolochytrium jonesii]|uniref:uncharacterized protein n=1 Tax=Fimicolochytrium jonesii TaxID=1396493 RepID=UPI0022FF30A9|nr:uncharacterized protein EV422DRAFT_144045 [Fimicolochytrium jonesii]KAI8825866.1 hypothetical protein EV422DRAFT_144045 [Fimicolochytrium jonesii]